MSPLLFANFGGEEGDSAVVKDLRPVLRNLRDAWAQIFTAGHAFDDVNPLALVAWLNTPRALGEAHSSQRSLFGAPPEVVDVVHDKAFCAAVVAAHHLLPEEVQKFITVLDPADLDVESMARAVAQAPLWSDDDANRGFAFKPRFGSSGRGRVDSRRPRSEWESALPRLKARGGVIVEPWFKRLLDLSAQWRVTDDGRIVLLGTTTARTSPAGLWQGAEMVIDDDGIPRSLGSAPAGQPQVSPWDRQLVDQSLLVVKAAAQAGYRGPCGVDAFVLLGPGGGSLLRLVELNARFTAGLVAVCLARGRKPAGGSALIFDPATSSTLFSRSTVPSE